MKVERKFKKGDRVCCKYGVGTVYEVGSIGLTNPIAVLTDIDRKVKTALDECLIMCKEDELKKLRKPK